MRDFGFDACSRSDNRNLGLSAFLFFALACYPFFDEEVHCLRPQKPPLFSYSASRNRAIPDKLVDRSVVEF